MQPGWRNGSRSGLKNRSPNGRVGSTPTPGTAILRSNEVADAAVSTPGALQPVLLPWIGGELLERFTQLPVSPPPVRPNRKFGSAKPHSRMIK